MPRALHVTLSLALGACASLGACERAAPAKQRGEPAELVLFAAASLRPAIEALEPTFEREHGAALRVSYAGSQELRTQLLHGAFADLLAVADERELVPLSQAGLCEPGVVLAENVLAVAVPKASQGVRAFSELASARRIVVAGAAVPLGRYTHELLERAGRGPLGPEFSSAVRARVVSEEPNAARVLTRVRLGEVDAAIVYRTDALAAAADVVHVPIPAERNVRMRYSIARLRRAAVPELARAFIDFARSSTGQRLLAARGFSPLDASQAAP